MSVCIFCFRGPENTQPYCTDNPGHGCTYGFHHEFPDGGMTLAVKANKPTVKKADKQVCTKCNVHAKNPVGSSNGCQHEYPT